MVTVSKTVKVRPQQDCGYLKAFLGGRSQQKNVVLLYIEKLQTPIHIEKVVLSGVAGPLNRETKHSNIDSVTKPFLSHEIHFPSVKWTQFLMAMRFICR